MTFPSKPLQMATRLILGSVVCWLLGSSAALASEANLAIPDLHKGTFTIAGQTISAWNLLFGGAWVILGTLGISLYLLRQIKNLPAHESMLNIAEIIFQTCKTYLIQQGKFLAMLFAIIASAMTYYFLALQGESLKNTLLVLMFSVVGIIGSYSVAWYGIRVNTYANARTAFASLECIELREHERVLAEGIRHRGHSALIDLVARKPA